MTLHFRETPDKIIVYFTDAKILDEARIQETGNGLLDVCKRAAQTAKKLVVDFRGVQVMSSALIGKLVIVTKLAKQNSLDLRLVNIAPNILEVFEITSLNRDDDGPDLLGALVPNPKPPDTLDGHAEPPSS